MKLPDATRGAIWKQFENTKCPPKLQKKFASECSMEGLLVQHHECLHCGGQNSGDE
jgi:hypothetical protein